MCLTLLRVFLTPKCLPVILSCNRCKTEAFNLSGITICHVIVWPASLSHFLQRMFSFISRESILFQ
jgi:hypothetical protein